MKRFTFLNSYFQSPIQTGDHSTQLSPICHFARGRVPPKKAAGSDAYGRSDDVAIMRPRHAVDD